MVRFASFAVLPVLATTLVAQSSNPFAGDAKAADVGKGMFRIYCSACHGIRAQGGRAPDLTRGAYNSGDQDADLFRTISQGVAGTEMEGYGASLEPDAIWRLVSFIRSVSGSLNNKRTVAAATGDVARGKDLFWTKGNCGSCHTVGATGGKFGPNLSRVGRQRSYDFLRASVVDPDRDLTDGYRTLTVVMRDGRKITGVERGLDNFTAQLVDASGRFYSFDKSEVASVQRETRSLMPENYGRLFSAAELDDLLAYLATLRGEERKP